MSHVDLSQSLPVIIEYSLISWALQPGETARTAHCLACGQSEVVVLHVQQPEDVKPTSA